MCMFSGGGGEDGAAWPGLAWPSLARPGLSLSGCVALRVAATATKNIPAERFKWSGLPYANSLASPHRIEER